MRARLAVPAVLALMLGPAGGYAQEPTPAPRQPARPIQVTDSAVARGQEVFHGTGNCSACHGVAGVGTDSGPPLAQGVWLHGPDSYEGILERVVHGIPRSYSTRDIAMPMRGWNALSDTQVRDVAAYVWSISHAWLQRPARTRKPS
jgi:mono/diheme cytochrome c family protein